MSNLPITVILALASAHAPQVAPETIVAFAKHESALDPLAIHDNADNRRYSARSLDGAIRLAYKLRRDGHAIDLGLLQISEANLGRLGLTISSAFDPVASIKAGARVMVEAYQQCIRTLKGEAALRCMASIYNTGDPSRALASYVPHLWRVADQIVPAIRDARQLRLPLPDAPPPASADGEFYDVITVHAPRPPEPPREPKQ